MSRGALIVQLCRLSNKMGLLEELSLLLLLLLLLCLKRLVYVGGLYLRWPFWLWRQPRVIKQVCSFRLSLCLPTALDPFFIDVILLLRYVALVLIWNVDSMYN